MNKSDTPNSKLSEVTYTDVKGGLVAPKVKKKYMGIIDETKLAVNDGIVLGMEQVQKTLNQFIEKKAMMDGHEEVITKNELNDFLDVYVANQTNHPQP